MQQVLAEYAALWACRVEREKVMSQITGDRIALAKTEFAYNTILDDINEISSLHAALGHGQHRLR